MVLLSGEPAGMADDKPVDLLLGELDRGIVSLVGVDWGIKTGSRRTVKKNRERLREVQLSRSSFQYRRRPKPDDRALQTGIKEVAAVRVRYGYLRITEMLKREGWQVGGERLPHLQV